MDGIACGREIEREHRERERIHKIAEGVGKVNAARMADEVVEVEVVEG